jgi:hypothetical protein
MTTITSSIIPTERLSRWRSEHADRYRFVLSDSSILVPSFFLDSSCIRNKKAWLINHTLFVTTWSDGTRPMRSPNPKEFHEMQWDPNYGAIGRLVDERELPITSLDRRSETSPPQTVNTLLGLTSRSQRLLRSLSRISFIEKIVEKLGKQKNEPEVEQRRRSWMHGSFAFDSSLLFTDKRAQCGVVSVPLPEGCQIPNANFARKFLIVDDGETLPSHLPISQMPTAESKATETIVEAANTGLLNQASLWLFRGPFTPQLGFDGGLDYQWNPQDSGITVKRFDLEAPLPEIPKFDLDCSSRGGRLPGFDTHVNCQPSSSKRMGRVFDSDNAAEVKLHTSICHSPDETDMVKDDRLLQQFPILPHYAPNKSAKAVDETPSVSGKPAIERSIRNVPPRVFYI